MAGILRGDILWARLGSPEGQEQPGRPILVISDDVFNERSGMVVGMAITSQPQRAGFPLTVELSSGDLPRRSWVKISQIRTLPITRLGARIGRVSPEEMVRIIEGLNEIVAA